MPLRPLFEALEPRQLLSTPAAAVRWPRLPFGQQTTVYVNQFGYAKLTGQRLEASAANGYEVFFDDPGTVIVRTNGPARTQIAYYDNSGSPTRTTSSQPRGGAIIEDAVHSKQIVHIAVRGRDARQTGRFNLIVEGVPHYVVRDLKIRPRLDAGTLQTSINNAGDTDFCSFTVSRTGRWQVSVEPQGQLDATMNIFDAEGKPLGGTYVQPINSLGAGGTEFWSAPLLKAGEQYFVRVDGEGAGLGRYQVRAQRIVTPVVSMRTVSGLASEAGIGGQFIVSRSQRSSIDTALSINYAVMGSAANGADYALLTGSVLLPAGSRSASIALVPLMDAEAENMESVTLELLPGRGYTLAVSRTALMATAWIADSPPPA